MTKKVSDNLSASVMLVAEGEIRAQILLDQSAVQPERHAAQELAEHIALISGARVQIVTPENHDAHFLPIMIGAADAQLDERIRLCGTDPWSFALVVRPERILLKGLCAEGSRCAVYELLEQLGVRWYMPGETGRCIPRMDTITVPVQETMQTPSFTGRRGSETGHAAVWNDRLRLGGQGRYGAHGIQPFVETQDSSWFERDPRLFALIGGERVNRQLCLTYSTDRLEENRTLQLAAEHYRDVLRANPDLRILNMGPNDGAGYCECSFCRALDPDGRHTTVFATPQPSFTDRYVWFFNRLTEALADEFPDIRIGFYAYAQHMIPPVREKPQNNLAISLAPILTCRIHGPNNPVCPESGYALQAYRDWRPYAGNHMADRGYLNNLADPGFPFPMVHRVREEIPAFHALGVRIWAADPADAWASHSPAMYVAAKLLWNHKTDVDALLDEFYRLFYGPAEQPMRAFHTLLEETIRDADCHTGGLWDIPQIYPPGIRRRARSYLEQASAEVALHDACFGTRVAIMTRSLDFLDAYCRQRACRDAFDFPGAYAAMKDARAIRDSLLTDFEYPMLMPRQAKSLFARFVEQQAEQEYISSGGDALCIHARLEPQWQFLMDPHDWGKAAGWQQPDIRGGNWQTLRSDRTWSEQGLRYYFGSAWYRQTVLLPAPCEDADLWFAGVDSMAEVWLNGQFIGSNRKGGAFDLDAYGTAFEPFAFDVSHAVVPGQINTLVVRTCRPRTAEIGTGGLMGPVMFCRRIKPPATDQN